MDKPLKELQAALIKHLEVNSVPYKRVIEQDTRTFKALEYHFTGGFIYALRAAKAVPQSELKFLIEFTAMLQASGRSILSLNPNE